MFMNETSAECMKYVVHDENKTAIESGSKLWSLFDMANYKDDLNLNVDTNLASPEQKVVEFFIKAIKGNEQEAWAKYKLYIGCNPI